MITILLQQLKQYIGNKMLNKLIKYYGSRRALHEALGITRQALSQHIVLGYLPPGRAIMIESLTNGDFKAKDLIKNK
jgi:DNA-binding transcriptional regulator YdaS (Cro superfamily)|tara:strand:+ start:594 stop:824 length:231 start_codon:yes stop_codon:yes gene_type:complete